MQQIGKIFGLVIVMLLLASCATQQYYASAVNSWQGASQEEVYHVWGYPNHVKRLPNGNKVLVYRVNIRGRNPVVSTPGSTTIIRGRHGRTRVINEPGTVTGGGTYHLRCTTWFELNSAGNVVNTSFRGNDCVATKEFMLAHIHQGV